LRLTNGFLVLFNSWKRTDRREGKTWWFICRCIVDVYVSTKWMPFEHAVECEIAVCTSGLLNFWFQYDEEVQFHKNLISVDRRPWTWQVTQYYDLLKYQGKVKLINQLYHWNLIRHEKLLHGAHLFGYQFYL
jgi:hypothetical protein